MKLIQAETDQHFIDAKTLFREYADSLHIDLSFQGFEDELRSLESLYSPPEGLLLIAYETGNPVGCVAVRSLPIVGDTACEMKRLYVRPSSRGRGIGRKLAREAVERARKLDYRYMYLDTLANMTPAISLYKSIGFTKVKPYYENPRYDARYFQRKL